MNRPTKFSLSGSFTLNERTNLPSSTSASVSAGVSVSAGFGFLTLFGFPPAWSGVASVVCAVSVLVAPVVAFFGAAFLAPPFFATLVVSTTGCSTATD